MPSSTVSRFFGSSLEIANASSTCASATKSSSVSRAAASTGVQQLVQGGAHAGILSLAMTVPGGAGHLLMETPFGRNSIPSA
jgi:hypothetical protein